MDLFDYLGNVPSYLRDDWSDLLDLALAHAQVVVVAMVIATVIGVGLGFLTYHRPSAAKAALTVTGIDVRQNVVDEIKKKRPEAELYVYPGAPHGLTDTHKQRVNDDLLAFLPG